MSKFDPVKLSRFWIPLELQESKWQGCLGRPPGRTSCPLTSTGERVSLNHPELHQTRRTALAESPDPAAMCEDLGSWPRDIGTPSWSEVTLSTLPKTSPNPAPNPRHSTTTQHQVPGSIKLSDKTRASGLFIFRSTCLLGTGNLHSFLVCVDASS